jgi:hypothetical protein
MIAAFCWPEPIRDWRMAIPLLTAEKRESFLAHGEGGEVAPSFNISPGLFMASAFTISTAGEVA